MIKINRAIISVSDKEGVVNFGKGLEELGIEILSTGGTARNLKDCDVKVKEIAEYTNSNEILGGRVKTLHPKIHGGILAMRDNKDHQEDMKENDIEPIDMVTTTTGILLDGAFGSLMGDQREDLKRIQRGGSRLDYGRFSTGRYSRSGTPV